MKKINMYNTLKKAIKEKPLNLSFPILNESINGIWKDLYIISGASAMGKTSFLTRIAWDIIENNKKTEVLFFSLDQSSSDISIKIASQSTEIPFSYLKNLKNDNIRYNRKLEKKLLRLKKYYQKITIFDNKYKSFFSLEDIIDIIKKKREINPQKNICVFIDQIYSIDSDNLDKITEILKKACGSYNISILASISLKGDSETQRPSRKHLKDISLLLSRAYAFFTIYNDSVNNFETPFMEWDWQTKNTLVPIIELSIIKNKIESFTGSLFFKFYKNTSDFIECLQPEIDNYNKMNSNLLSHKNTENGKER